MERERERECEGENRGDVFILHDSDQEREEKPGLDVGSKGTQYENVLISSLSSFSDLDLDFSICNHSF